jgi:hypothetical protein
MGGTVRGETTSRYHGVSDPFQDYPHIEDLLENLNMRDDTVLGPLSDALEEIGSPLAAGFRCAKVRSGKWMPGKKGINYSWFKGRPSMPCVLPAVIYGKLTGTVFKGMFDEYKIYPSRAAAYLDLAYALIPVGGNPDGMDARTNTKIVDDLLPLPLSEG